MKVRTDFVTNSSSSSYVIAYRDSNEFSQKIINAIINTTDYDDTRKATAIPDKDAYNKMFMDEYAWLGNTLEEIFEAEDGLEEQYDYVVNMIQNGYKLIKKRISDHDSAFTSFLSILAEDNKDFVILSDGG